jgi:threonine dehydratase
MSKPDKSYPIAASYAPRIARARVYDVAIESPLDRAPRLSARLGHDVLLKREDLQAVFSFKLRGSYNKIAQTPPEQLANGVICSSAGNHAQGVALAARKRGLRAVIVMPKTTPSIKVDAVVALGGEAVLHGITYDDANAHARELELAQGLCFVHPFNDPDVIAGQGTIGGELERQWPKMPHAVFVPIGGGGLISGIGSYLKHRYPKIKVIGVEPVESASMYESFRAGRIVTLDRVGTFADGVAVRRVGDETFRVASEVVDEILLVNTDEMCAAIKDIFEDVRVVVEPAGALAVAGMKRYVERLKSRNETLIAVNSGANMNFARLRHVTERAEIGEQREALLAVEIPERPGALLAFLQAIGDRWNISLFHYRNHGSDYGRVLAGVQVPAADRGEFAEHLARLGYDHWDETDNPAYRLFLRAP